MKKYIKPAIEIVELESKERMADVNPAAASSTVGADGTVTTVYNLASIYSTSNDKQYQQ